MAQQSMPRGSSEQLVGGSSEQLGGGGGGGEAAASPKRQRLEEIPDGGLIFEAREGIAVDPDALKLIKDAARKMFLAQNFVGPDQQEHRCNTVSVKIDKRKLSFLVSLSYRRRSCTIIEHTQQCTGDEVEPAPPLCRLPPLPAGAGTGGSALPAGADTVLPVPWTPGGTGPWPCRIPATTPALSSASLTSATSTTQTLTLGQGQSLELTAAGAELISD
jgi:hypothetical protein